VTSADDLGTTLTRIGITRDYAQLELDGFEPDVDGWGFQHPIFDEAIERYRPRVVVEVGTWKGASVLRMHGASLEHGTGTEFVCVDTWLGSAAEIWLDPDTRRSLHLEGGYPTMFRQFVANVLSHGAQDVVYPLPMTSSAAAHVLERLGVMADVVYIDAGHEYEEVSADLRLYWSLLRPGGLMFGDDFAESWPGVQRAVVKFARRHGLDLETQAEKWLLPKPLEPRRWPRLRGGVGAVRGRASAVRGRANRRWHRARGR
jgi:hypothetical protein